MNVKCWPGSASVGSERGCLASPTAPTGTMHLTQTPGHAHVYPIAGRWCVCVFTTVSTAQGLGMGILGLGPLHVSVKTQMACGWIILNSQDRMVHCPKFGLDVKPSDTPRG